MSFKLCALCGQRVAGKPAVAYWAWFLADNRRSAWKQTLCSSCLVTNFRQLLVSSNSTSTDELTCPGCGGGSQGDLDPVYLTLYVPKRESLEYELALCAACAAKIRGTMQTGAVQLEDRGAQMRGPSSESPDPWSELEL